MSSMFVADTALYGYVPTQYACIIFVVFFSLSTATHLFQSTYYRLYWLAFTLVPGGLLEILGWSGRLWNSKNPRALDGYLMQICCLILGPAFLMAANYLLLGLLINKLGSQYARIPPKWYTIVFCTGDIISLVIQAIGGGGAAIAVQSNPPRDPDKGARIMVGGIVFQMVIMVLFTAIGTEFLLRWAHDKPFRRTSNQPLSDSSLTSSHADNNPNTNHKAEDHRRWKLVIVGLSFSTLCIFIRSIYRTIELSNGWTSHLARHQPTFNFLDGFMILLAMLAINFLHPGQLLDTRRNVVELGMRKKKNQLAPNATDAIGSDSQRSGKV